MGPLSFPSHVASRPPLSRKEVATWREVLFLEREANIRAQEADSQERQVTEDQSAAALSLRGVEYTLFFCVWLETMSAAVLPLQRPEAEAAQEQSKGWSRAEAMLLTFPAGNPKTESRRGMMETWSLAGGEDQSRKHGDKRVKCPC